METGRRVSLTSSGLSSKWRGQDVLLVGQLSSPLDRFGLFVQVVVLVRRGKVWLVTDVHDGVDAGAVGSQVCLGGVHLEDVV